MVKYSIHYDECEKILKQKQTLVNSKEFASNWTQFEKNWTKWNYKQIVLWFKRVLTITANNDNNYNYNNDTLQQQDEKQQQLQEITGQIVITRGNLISSSDKINPDWQFIETNLKRRELDPNIIC